MTTMADYHYVKDQDGSSLWIKETPSVSPSAVSRFRSWLFPALIVVVIISITALGVTIHSEMKTSNHLWSVEQRVSNMSDIIQSLDASLQQAQEKVKEVQQLQFAVENNKDQLTSVSEALKQLSVIDSLSKSVTAIKYALERIINNSSATGGCCPLGWTVFDSSCYYFSRESLSWNESRIWCEKQQAHLVILLTDKEWDFVTHQTIPEFFWIGLSDWRTGNWEWVNHTPYTVERRRWKPGQPDDWSFNDKNEDCAHLHNDGRLNDLHCFISMRFICQKKSLVA